MNLPRLRPRRRDVTLWIARARDAGLAQRLLCAEWVAGRLTSDDYETLTAVVGSEFDRITQELRR